MNDSDEEIVLAFLEESRENLDQLDRDLIALESDSANRPLLAQVFRTIHTIKGTCGFLGFHHLESLTHAGENLLGALRSGELVLSASITTSLLQLVDAVRHILAVIERTGTEGDGDHSAVIAALHLHLAPQASVPPAAAATAAIPTTTTIAATTPPVEDDVVAAPAVEPAPDSSSEVVGETTVRVDVAVLDKLMDLVGELVLTRSQFGASDATSDDGPLALPYRQLRLVTSELQEGVMQARLQPLGTVTGRLRRIVRDLAATLAKQIDIHIEGEEIGVDKAVNEALRDPLLHLVRNAVDHGIELPADRVAAGKPAAGTLRLRAFHEGGRVHIELADDGGGIDRQRLVAAAIAGGTLTAAEAAVLTPDDALELMFRAGLSTKDAVTNISGRGVGLDVVRSTLERVGGTIQITSEPGSGSTFRLTVPLTLAIMPVLIASVRGGRYAIPQVDVQEVVHVAAEQVAATVHDVDGALILRLRDRLVPLVDLAEQFRLAPLRAGSAVDPGGTTAGMTVIVVETARRRFGVVVDGVGDTAEVIVKPLTRATRAIRLFGGITILADGQPALILDVGGLAAEAGIVVPSVDESVATKAERRATTAVLLASDAAAGRIAITTAGVVRLVQLPTGSVERVGAFEAVRYGDDVLPIVRLGHDGWAGRPADAPPDRSPGESMQVVVCRTSVGVVGVVVDRIEDVVEVPDTVMTASTTDHRRSGRWIVVADRVTELVDVEALVAASGLGRTA